MAANTQPVGIFYAWWRGDPLPELARQPAVAIGPVAGAEEAAAVARVFALADVERLIGGGHRLYVARHGAEIVAVGWAATTTAEIGELGVRMVLPPGNRYLWGFETLSVRRGQGIYPALLRAIIAHDVEGDRFWIGHDYDNDASARGIARAGFTPVGEVVVDEGGRRHFVPRRNDERARAAAALLGMRAPRAS